MRFAPPDALADPAEAIGRSRCAPIPPGSYLLASHLRAPGARSARRAAAAGEPTCTRSRSRSAAPARSPRQGPPPASRVDVVVAGEPVTGGRARVRVAAEAVRLIALEPAAPERRRAGGESWNATLALERGQALRLIEAENFAREIRLIPSG